MKQFGKSQILSSYINMILIYEINKAHYFKVDAKQRPREFRNHRHY